MAKRAKQRTPEPEAEDIIPVSFEDLESQTVPEPEEEDTEPVVVRPMQFGPLKAQSAAEEPISNLVMLMDVGMKVTVELGRTTMSIKKVLSLTRGSVVELDKLAGEVVDVYVNDSLIAHGEVVVVGEKFGVRITELVGHARGISVPSLH